MQEHGVSPPPSLLRLTCTVVAIAVAVVLEGCGAKLEHSPTQLPAEHRHPDNDAGRAKHSHVEHSTPAPTHKPKRVNKFLQAPDQDGSPGFCPAFIHKDSHGRTVRILRTEAGKAPVILCPANFEYRGRNLECGWVDQVCQVEGPHDVVTPDLCVLEYKLTEEGQGLQRWPSGVTPRLVSRRDNSSRMVELDQGDRSRIRSLPAVVQRDSLECEREGFVDLDFEHAKLRVTGPPFTEEAPWSKTYTSIASVGELRVDLQVTSTTSVNPPGNMQMDGNSSVTGRINMERWGPSTLRFEFVETGTQTPIKLNKVFFSIFDLHDGANGHRNKMVTADQLEEYYVSTRTQISANKSVGSTYIFTAADGPIPSGEAVGDSVEAMWSSSLERMVVLTYRNTANFSLTVQAVPRPDGQVLEFAGWSELVDLGTRVQTMARAPDDGQEVVIEDALSDEPLGSEVTSAYSLPSAGGPVAPHGLLPSVPRQRARWAPVEALAAVSALAALVGAAVVAQQRWRWPWQSLSC